MALIPKGRYRGMVLVWNKIPVLGRHPTLPPPPNEFTSFQAYSIIDPAGVPSVTDPLPGGPKAFRYRNFLLPVELSTNGQLYSVVPDTTVGTDAYGLFCSGHVWTSFGDLVVVGGTDFDWGRAFLYAGTKMSYVFNPRHAVAPYPGTGGSMYPGFQGLWQYGPYLTHYRWYPTATLTHRIQRTPVNNRELVLVLGGSKDDDNSLQGNTPGNNPQWNNYEALIVQGESAPVFGGHNLGADSYNATSFWFGPGTQVPPLFEEDWFEEYPRCHLLSDGRILFSGYAPRWATLDPEMQGTWTRALLQTVTGTGGMTWGAYTSTWFDPAAPGHVGFPRHDGTSVLFPNFGGASDIVMRIGGANKHFYLGTPPMAVTTATVETVQPGPNAQWQPAPHMPSTHPPTTGLDGGRVLSNAVTLPNGDVLVIGGVHFASGSGGGGSVSTPVYAPVVFHDGDWKVVPPNPVPSIRDYHSTAIQLDDGRIFIGGGEGRTFDYEILSPPYMSMVRPDNLVWKAPAPSFDPFLGAHELLYDQRYHIGCDQLPVGVAVVKAVLTSPCSVTHHSDMHQRYIELPTDVQGGNDVTFSMPSTDTAAPRGLYMLWLVTNAGAPSKAMWVVLR